MQRFLVTLLSIYATFSFSYCFAQNTYDAASETRRELNNGTIIGFLGENGGHALLGIPYAMPPVGTLRWKAPETPVNWSGLREAVALPDMCSQYAGLGSRGNYKKGALVGSESGKNIDRHCYRNAAVYT